MTMRKKRTVLCFVDTLFHLSFPLSPLSLSLYPSEQKKRTLRRNLRHRLPFLRPRRRSSSSLVLLPQLRRHVVDRRVELRDPVREVLLRHRLPRPAAPVAAVGVVEEARQLEPALVVGEQGGADLRGEEEAQGAEDDAAQDEAGGEAAGSVAALGAESDAQWWWWRWWVFR